MEEDVAQVIKYKTTNDDIRTIINKRIGRKITRAFIHGGAKFYYL